MDSHHNVYVIDRSNDKVYKINTNTLPNPSFSFRVPDPQAITVDSSDTVYVVSVGERSNPNGESSIYRIPPDGAPIRITFFPPNSFQLGGVATIAIDNNQGFVYVTSYDCSGRPSFACFHTLHKYALPDFDLKTEISLQNPAVGAAVDKFGLLHLLTPEGIVHRMYDSNLNGPLYALPIINDGTYAKTCLSSLAVDSTPNIYMGNYCTKTVEVYTYNGNFVRSIPIIVQNYFDPMPRTPNPTEYVSVAIDPSA
jgi:outer membrane protein assembly factor BamB